MITLSRQAVSTLVSRSSDVTVTGSGSAVPTPISVVMGITRTACRAESGLEGAPQRVGRVEVGRADDLLLAPGDEGDQDEEAAESEGHGHQSVVKRSPNVGMIGSWSTRWSVKMSNANRLRRS